MLQFPLRKLCARNDEAVARKKFCNTNTATKAHLVYSVCIVLGNSVLPAFE